jgi:N-acetylmuramoyl-L-alanine amidase
MKVIKIVGYVIIACCYHGTFMAAAKINHITNVFHHKLSGIEIGSLSFYFSHMPAYNNPQIVNIDTANNVHAQMNKNQLALKKAFIVFFPKTAAQNHDVNALISSLNKSNDFPYKVVIQEVKEPLEGIKVSILYDPDKIDIKYDVYNSIKLQAGIVITMYDKNLIKQLGEKSTKAILTTVSAKKPFGVIIDCGHGGKDYGAKGFFNIFEKDVTLNIGIEVAQLLNKNGFDVMMTRSTDCDVPLDKRTSLANKYKCGDLFVSIHANYANSDKTSGIETYYLHNRLFRNFYSTLNKQTKKLIAKLELDRCAKSELFAKSLHTNVLSSAQKKNAHIVDRKVKQAISQVLLGTSMPAALVEIGFLSNKFEASMLKNKQYSQLLAQGICNGIMSYFNTVNV